MMKTAFATVAATVALLLPVRAEREPTPEQIAAFQKRMKAIGELQYRSGEITLAGGKVKVALPPEFQYLDASNARKVWVDIYGNPPQQTDSGDGMIVPKGYRFFGGEGWLAELKWRDDGYVKDDEFAKLDFAKMLDDLKAGQKAASDERVRSGYGRLELAGWAQQPHYDRATHKLYYAKLFDTDGPEQQLNYDIRVLGRHGVLEVSIVSSASQMALIEGKAPAILGMVDFTEGNRYTDYKAGDKVAAYGIAGLIAGGVLAKAGFFKVIGVFLLKFSKVIIVGLIALVAGLAKLFGKKKPAGAA